MEGLDETNLDPTSPPRLILNSQLEDLARVLPWVESIAGQYSILPDTRFAIELCLEEALSNIIRHGYRGQADHAITVACAAAGGDGQKPFELVFTIEDQAPPFDPLAFPTAPDAPAIDELPLGGQGIRLMRKFASRAAWEQVPGGNRLTLAFDLTQ